MNTHLTRSPLQSLTAIAVAISIGVFASPAVLLAQSNMLLAQSNSSGNKQPAFPGRRVSAGSRGANTCAFSDTEFLTAILPKSNLGLTLSAYPQFLWVLPPTNARWAQFSLYEVDSNLQNPKLFYNTTFVLNPNNRQASLTLPSGTGVPPLVVGKTYRWTVTVICNLGADLQGNPSLSDADATVFGWVRRVAPSADLTTALGQLNPSDRSEATLRKRTSLYLREGIWFDALSLLVDLQCRNPTDTSLQQGWTKILTDEGLGAIAALPMTNQCPK